MDSTVRRERDRLQRENDELRYILDQATSIDGRDFRAVKSGTGWELGLYVRTYRNGRFKNVVRSTEVVTSHSCLHDALVRSHSEAGNS